jgi:hypothetical protein
MSAPPWIVDLYRLEFRLQAAGVSFGVEMCIPAVWWNANRSTQPKIVRFNNSMGLCQFLLDFENYYV